MKKVKAVFLGNSSLPVSSTLIRLFAKMKSESQQRQGKIKGSQIQVHAQTVLKTSVPAKQSRLSQTDPKIFTFIFFNWFNNKNQWLKLKYKGSLVKLI